ncbi:MAG: cytochrome c [Cellvibrionaceae bacterium]|jgi:cytochrome c553
MKRILFIALAIIVPSLSFAATPVKEATCRACHGVEGAKPIVPNYPKLNGQNKAYIVAALNAYKNGSRTGGLAGMMKGIASGLSDAEMNELAEYYSKL